MADTRYDRGILQVQPTEDPKEYQRRVNEVFRRISESIVKLEGRSGTTDAKNSISISSGNPTLLGLLGRGGICYGGTSTPPRTFEFAGGAHRDTDGQWIADDTGAVILQLRSDGSFYTYGNTGLLVGQAFTPTFISGSPFVGARVHNSGDTSLTTSGLVMSWNVVDYDTSSFFAAGSPTRLTVINAGYYQVSARIRFNATVTETWRQMILLRNSSATFTAANEIGRVIHHKGPANVAQNYELNTVVYLASEDYVELYLNTGENVTVPNENFYYDNPSFSLVRLGA